MSRAALLVLLTGCGVVATPAPTYHAAVRPILDRHCMGCHDDGGIGPLSFHYDAEDWADGAPAWTTLAAHEVDVGAMPPWPPSTDCHPLADERVLSADEKATIAAWASAGFPEGDASAYVAPEPERSAEDELGPPDLELKAAEPYVADTSRDDDWRCFVVDHDFATDAWVRAFTVAPDRVDLVHHVLVYRLPPEYADDVAQWDADDEGTGYTCFGSPGTWDADTLAGWAPGQRPEVYADGVARRIEAGSKLVVQVHYNTTNAHDQVVADQSAVKLWLLPEGETPRQQLYSIPFADDRLRLKAGDHHVVAGYSVDLGDYLPIDLEVIGVGPHMHQLGTKISASVLRADGTRECAVRIEDWDFHWQGSYYFAPGDTMFVGPTDALDFKCVYDNSAANQPLVDGVPQEPREVTWGESTSDEMCLMYAHVLVPPGFL